MITEKVNPSAQTGEDQASSPVPVRAPEVFRAPWLSASIELLAAAKKLTGDWLRDENEDVELCFNTDHHAAIRALFTAIERAEAVDLAAVGPLKQAALVGEPLSCARVSVGHRDTAMLANLIHANDLLDAEGMSYTIGSRVIALSDLVDADDVILIMSERAHKLISADADGYPGVGKMQKGILNGALRAWILLCCPPDCLGGDQDAGASGAVGSGQ